jgi:hypothetical protein
VKAALERRAPVRAHTALVSPSFRTCLPALVSPSFRTCLPASFILGEFEACARRERISGSDLIAASSASFNPFPLSHVAIASRELPTPRQVTAK